MLLMYEAGHVASVLKMFCGLLASFLVNDDLHNDQRGLPAPLRLLSPAFTTLGLSSTSQVVP